MENRKTYIIADFVKILGVARTTLKDWLARYEEYIEFEVRGHRKIYFDSSLKILKEIAEMRGKGQTASEILAELSRKHPVNADITHEVGIPQIEKPETEENHFPVKNNPLVEAILPIVKQQNEEMERMLSGKLHDMASNLHEAQLSSLLPIVKRQNEKMERMLTGKLHDMASNLHRNQLDANQLSKQSSRRILLVIALILTLVVAVILTSSNIYYVLMNQKQHFNSVEKNLEESISQNKDLFVSEIQKRAKADEEQKFKLQNLTVMLERNNKSAHKDITNLKSSLDSQQKAFNAMMDKYNKAMNERREQEISLFEKTFDKKRGVLLEKIDELAKKTAANKSSDENETMQVLELKQKLFDLREKMDILQREKEKAEKSVITASFFPNPNRPMIRPAKKK
jgi:hypothetical protein